MILLGLKFVNLEILSTSFIDFLVGGIKSRSLGLEGMRGSVVTSVIFSIYTKARKYQGLKYTNQELPYVYSLTFR